MRILIVQESDWLQKGPHQSHHLLERMSERGHTVRVVDFEILWKSHNHQSIVSQREIFENVRKATDHGGVTVYRPPIIRLPILVYPSLLYSHLLEIRRQMKVFKPDVALAFGVLNAFILSVVAKRANIPFVYYVIDELHRLVPEKIFQGFAKVIEQSNMRSASVVISINDRLMQYALDMGAARSRSKVIGAGIDSGRFRTGISGTDIRRNLAIQDNELVLFFMGWLYEFSGLADVASTLLSSDDHRDVRLLVIGRGEQEEALRMMASTKEGKRQMSLLGWQKYEDVPRFIAASDLCILPAHNTGIMKNIVPIKMYEYMAMGKPVIATDLPGLRSEFGDGNGVLWVESAKDVVRKAIEMKKEGILAVEGAKAAMFAQKREWKTIVDDFERTLQNLVAGS